MTENNSPFSSVLIVDSDQIIQKGVAQYLSHINVGNIKHCADGHEALRLIEQQQFDLIVLDWRMKNPSGNLIYEKIRASEHHLQTPVILTSGFITKDDVKVVSSEQKTKFIVKPFTEDVFISTINVATGLKLKPLLNAGPTQNLSSDSIEKLGSNLSLVKNTDGKSDRGLYLDKNAKAEAGESQVQQGQRSKSSLMLDQGEPALKGTLDIDAGAKKIRGEDLKAGSSAGNEFSARQSQPQTSGEFSAVQSRNQAADGDFSAEQANGYQSGDFSVQKPVIQKPGEISGQSNKMRQTSDFAFNDPKNQLGEITGSEPNFVSEKIRGLDISISQPLRAVIVDADASICNLLNGYLKKLGTQEIETFSDDESAWQAIKSSPSGIIVMDWQGKGSGGLRLYNRIRTKIETKKIPVIVLSGLVRKADFNIINESRCTKFIEKPFRINDFDSVLKDVLRSTITQDQIAEFLQQAIDLAQDDEKKVMAIIEDVLRHIPDGFEVLIAAGKYLVGKRFYLISEKVFKVALRVNAKSVLAMTELSKIYHMTNRPNEALKLLTTADGIAPGSIERMCLMGEVGLNLQKTDEAKNYFQKALNIDSENETAKAGLVVADNLKDFLNQGTHGISVQAKIAATLNLVGVTYVRNKQVKKGIEQYQSALCFAHDSENTSRIQFNLAIAYLRLKDKGEALRWLKKALDTDPMYKKAADFQQKILKVESGADIEILLSSELEDVPFELPTINKPKNKDTINYGGMESQALAKLKRPIK